MCKRSSVKKISNADITPFYKDIQMPSILRQFRVNNISQIVSYMINKKAAICQINIISNFTHQSLPIVIFLLDFYCTAVILPLDRRCTAVVLPSSYCILPKY